MRFILIGMLSMGVLSCTPEPEKTKLEEVYLQAADTSWVADASVITDRFVLVPELQMVFPRPQGKGWTVTKHVEKKGSEVVVDVEMLNPLKGGKINVILARGDAEAVEAQVRFLRMMLGQNCGTDVQKSISSGMDQFTVRLGCIAKKKVGDKEVTIYMQAAVTAKRRIPGKTMTVIGFWTPKSHEEMDPVFEAVIEQVQPLLDASLGHP